MSEFKKIMLEYISNKTISVGRYNLVGIPFEYIKEFTSDFSKKNINYKGTTIEVPIFSGSREIPIICSNLDSNEKELAMNIRNNSEVFSDYIFVSENEIRLDSGENTITVFPQNWNNNKNDFLLFIYQSNKEFKNAIKIFKSFIGLRIFAFGILFFSCNKKDCSVTDGPAENKSGILYSSVNL